jgi:S1-C subfamily serine protease
VIDTLEGIDDKRYSLAFILLTVIIGAVAGGFVGYSLVSGQITDLQEQVSALQSQIESLELIQNVTYVVGGETGTLSELYGAVKESIVTVQGVAVEETVWGQTSSTVQGSGFVYNYTGDMVVVTNYHVIEDTVELVVTFASGNSYEAEVLGSDAYADLAVIQTEAPQDEYKPLTIVSSSTLNVGDPVIAFGSPYGLAGSMTTGIVSQLGRTITEESTGGYVIADIIQISAPINPGNSGGPLLNYNGDVVGVTTAIVSDSQGLGFAIPSNTILREINSLITDGHYDQHSWLGVTGINVNYEIAEAMNVNVTYGWLIIDVVNGGPAHQAGLQGGTEQTIIEGTQVTIGGDIIIAFNGEKIKNLDDLATYLEEHTTPGQEIEVTIIRNNEKMIIPVELGKRPPPS